MAQRVINFGIIGCGLMGREFASAVARWAHLSDPKTGQALDFLPRITAVCNRSPEKMDWFTANFDSIRTAVQDYTDLLSDPTIEAIYCAVPHNLHAQVYIDVLEAGKHLLGEKPFGIDLEANQQINRAINGRPDLQVSCSSQFAFYPGAYRIAQWIAEGRFDQIIEVEAGFDHCSDLNPNKPINWKRQIDINGEYGCMGDLGMHVALIPFRAGWIPNNVRALLSNIMTERPGPDGKPVPCETWDNAILACQADTGDQRFPMLLSTRRIAPGQINTWYLRVTGTNFSASFSTKYPKSLHYLTYTPGGSQSWQVEDIGYKSAYPAISGEAFEFGFSDALLQMWAAFCDELVNGRDGMSQPFYCATPEELTHSHRLFTAALESERSNSVVIL